METRLYLMDCSTLENSASFTRALPFVSASRRTRALSYDTAQDQALSLGAGLLLDRVLRREGITAEVLRGDDGHPYVEARPELYVSLSHSFHYAMCGLSLNHIAVDIQVHKGALPAIVRRFFHPDEQAYLAALPERQRETAFYEIWSRKECYIKLHGMSELESFSVLSPAEGFLFESYPVSGYACWSYRTAAGERPCLEELTPETLLSELERS